MRPMRTHIHTESEDRVLAMLGSVCGGIGSGESSSFRLCVFARGIQRRASVCVIRAMVSGFVGVE